MIGHSYCRGLYNTFHVVTLHKFEDNLTKHTTFKVILFYLFSHWKQKCVQTDKD